MKNYYEMVWLAFNCNYSSNFYCDLLCPLSVGNIFILFTNHIFYSICRIFQILRKQITFIRMSNLWIIFIRKLLSSMWYKALKPISSVLLHFCNRIGDISTKAPYIANLHIVLWVTLSVSHQSDKKND